MKIRSAAMVSLVAGVMVAVSGCSGSSGTPQAATSEQTAPAAQQNKGAPAGSGHGLCFDLNSGLANESVKRLSAAPIGTWSIGLASDDPISAGCDGVLSWMTVNTDTNHPYTHVLFFTGGEYLGTATAEPYMFTVIAGKTRNTVSVTYRWTQNNDPMCCPQGGPSTVVYTLNGTTVQAKGQFPPHN
ncbi:LppP/LprE family lipoprotein [Nocardia yamanashiensis]|uniref:LppP/LprE family lipoprotein n=1 Tax=Nocardia yamanashiensis TaxID=209247 RepID=UPI001E4A8C16|nr:LppP/LprE family lipoprotein [Nocardia yamanashiensis]UGT41558.1 LppP/LprE family lipoprotein [Nocardia yamanashiensis]